MTGRTPRERFGGIAFLHTTPGHVATFGVLMTEMAPNVPVRHTVNVPLLQAVREAGTVTPDIAARTCAALEELSLNGARVVVFTCSTLGGCLDGLDRTPGTIYQRIDRPMADAAVRLGGRILIAATVEESLDSTVALIHAAAAANGRTVTVKRFVVPDTWALFVGGERTAYRKAIAEAVRGAAHDVDAVVLAQASMAAAADDLADLGIPVLSSPRLGVAAAISAWRSVANHSALS